MKDLSKHLPREFYSFDKEGDWEALQFSCFLDVKKLAAELLKEVNKMPQAGAKKFPSSFVFCLCLFFKVISGMSKA